MKDIGNGRTLALYFHARWHLLWMPYLQEGAFIMATTKTPNMTDYEAERRNFHLDVPEQFNFATDVVGKWAQDPHKLAILWVGPNNEVEQVTFAQFAERSSRAANAFASAG